MDNGEEKFVPDVSRPEDQHGFEALEGIQGVLTTQVYPSRERIREEEQQREINKKIRDAYRRGVEESRCREMEVKQYFAGVVKEILDSRSSMLLMLENEVRELSVSIAEQVLKREIEANVAECLKEQVNACIQSLDGEVPVILRVNPSEADLLNEILQDDQDIPEQLEGVKICGDSRVERGGCVMETDRSMLRAELSRGLNAISEALKGEYEKSIAEEMESSPQDG